MSLTRSYSGKVRDIYEIDDDHLLMVASDRISAFDVVLPEPVPGKGRVLAGLTAFWLARLADLAPSHLVSTDPASFPAAAESLGDLAGRAMLVRRADMLPIECIVRGYLSGSAWKEYRDRGTMHGVPLPAGLAESDRLPEPRFTPSTKAATGHDENISREEAAEAVGAEVARAAEDLCVAAYERAAAWAAERGIIIADTKFELGVIDGALAICDEVLTPDSSRFWPADQWAPGSTPPSYDKQPVRDWLEASGWDKTPPPPHLPPEVVEASAERYATAYERLTGQPLSSWDGRAWADGHR
ncbi:MAG TPA: phosphoribosylaminoimidazolesuccinocarboxamide synthase [Acidimicrobiales bacterium]|nr:phosphoribosylaminoimidazolesuccinocarboxamide synthase [Acidimicrobiales bacterium]